jgi:hypothetical protein
MSEETTQSPAPSGSGLDRRKVLRASAWAAPVVLVATATPAAAASKKVTADATYLVNNPDAASNNPGKLKLNGAQLAYDRGVWNTAAGIGWNDTPTQATVVWTVFVQNSAGTVVHTFRDTQPTVTTGWISSGGEEISNLPSGQYTVISRLMSVTYAPNPVGGVTFATDVPREKTTTVTVA